MNSFVLTIHIILAVGLTLLVLVQRSEGGILGGLGGNAGASSFLTGRQAGNFLSKLTGYFFVAFIFTSLTLVIMAKKQSVEPVLQKGVIPFSEPKEMPTPQPTIPLEGELPIDSVQD